MGLTQLLTRPLRGNPSGSYDPEALGVATHLDNLTAKQVAHIGRPTGNSHTIAPETPMHEVIPLLLEFDSLGLDGMPVVVDKHCLDTIPFRSWMFGVLSALEMCLRTDMGKGDAWREILTPERIEKAQQIKAERARRGEKANTIDCIQFGDLAGYATRDKRWFDVFDFGSRRKAKKLFRRLEMLRNALAHSQEGIAEYMEIMSAICRNVEVLRIPCK